MKPKFMSENAYQQVELVLDENINIDNYTNDSIEVFYGILGLDHIKNTIILPKQLTKQELSQFNYTTQEANYSTFDFIKLNKENCYTYFRIR